MLVNDANINAENKIQDAAWYYAQPYEKAAHIKDHVAFCECDLK